MTEIKLQILDTPAGEKFDHQVKPYMLHMSEAVGRFPKLIQQIQQTDEATDYFERYSIYMRWGIRKLEYAFALSNLPPGNQLRLLDVGSGVTILPHVLARMGHQVDALDPAEDWPLRKSEIAHLYNAFYECDVHYINDFIYTLETEETYDSIISISVLEHLPEAELKETIQKIFWLLRPGGTLIMTLDYCPRVKISKFSRLYPWLRTISRGLRMNLNLSQGGFPFCDFKSRIYNNLPGKGDLDDLRRQDKTAISYYEFWSSHAFESCLYNGYRPYLSLGVICAKPE